MDTPVLMPNLGNEIDEAQIEEWLKSEGDAVKEGEELVLITTPKVTMEIEAPATGVLKKIIVPVSELAAVGTTLGIIES